MLRISRQAALRRLVLVLFLLASPLCARASARQIGAGSAMLQGGLPLQSQATTGNVTSPDFSVSVGILPDILPRGKSYALTTIVAALGSYSGPVKLSIVEKLPTNVTATFTPDTVTPLQPRPTWSATISSQLVIEAVLAPPAKTTAQVKTSGRGRTVLAACSLLLFVPAAFSRRLRRRIAPLCALALLACLPMLQGCGEGRYPPTIASEVYPITILAVGANGVQHTVPLMIRVQ